MPIVVKAGGYTSSFLSIILNENGEMRCILLKTLGYVDHGAAAGKAMRQIYIMSIHSL